MKRWHLESIVDNSGNRRFKRLALPDRRTDGLFSGKRKIDFRPDSRLAGLKKRLAALLSRSGSAR
ncbi:hypothetical protein [Desulfofustis glycolicus]|uniref:hypothetical protein n=1 Tax=Desulfofustis glycolicus TaxID=51195 RepID=UPI000932FB55|nr:hypothetical protein [Desulfofustis glycolicus]MCB2218222.1 hypothetical protein [Desulfobulbaceae bacterium]